jgi:hypothetical protein
MPIAKTDPLAAWDDHWHAYAEAFVHPLQNNGMVSRFVTNPVVTGAYAEAWIRSIAQSMLGGHFRISTGAVVRSGDASRGLDTVLQCDLIVWDPSELPGLFECGGFAIVPFTAVHAVVEVKRRARSISGLLQQLSDRRHLVPRRVLEAVVEECSGIGTPPA